VAVRIAVVGDRNERYPSHRELDAVLPMLGDDVEARWVATDGADVRELAPYDGVWLAPGSPYADDDAAYAAITFARSRGVPFLGTCGGLQYAVVEFFRNVIGQADASHAESDGSGDGNVVRPLACSLMGQERDVVPVAGTRFADLVSGRSFVGMHYCSYAPDDRAVERLVGAGMQVEATADDAGAEVLTIPQYPFFVLSLFQPQIGALAGRPVHPLLTELVRTAREHGRRRVLG
jgi:CTP synthase (UTP-ammonia lyase)